MRGRRRSGRGHPVAAHAAVVDGPELHPLAVAVGLDASVLEHRAAADGHVTGPGLERHGRRRGRRREREPRVEVQRRSAREPHRRAALRVGEGGAALGGVEVVEGALAGAPVPDLDGLDGVGAVARGRPVDEAPLVERGRGGAGVGGRRGDARVDGRGLGAGVGGRGRPAVAVHAHRAAAADPAAAAAVVAVLGQVDAGAAAEHQTLAADHGHAGVDGRGLRTAVGGLHAGVGRGGHVDVRRAGVESEGETGGDEGTEDVLHGGRSCR